MSESLQFAAAHCPRKQKVQPETAEKVLWGQNSRSVLKETARGAPAETAQPECSDATMLPLRVHFPDGASK